MLKISTLLRLSLMFLIPAFVSSCMATAKAPNPIYYYTLDYEAPTFEPAHQLPCVLRVERFSATPPFNSQRIIYAHSELQRNSYAYHQWIAPPAELLPYFLARDLRQSNGFEAVLAPDATIAPTHSLYGWVEQFLEQDGSPEWKASAVIQVTLISNLIHDPTQKILLQKRYAAATPFKTKTPEALARAMSQAVSNISRELERDIYNRLTTVEPLKY